LDQVRAAGATVVGASDHTVTHSVYILDPDGKVPIGIPTNV
jgi:catechol-2,3-dioxygenase